MTLRHIRIFWEVCQQGNSITRAAHSLYMTQPAVSQAIRELEEHYGLRLFERYSRRLYITPAGQRLYQHAGQLLQQVERMEKSLQSDEDGGPLRVGATVTIGSQFLPCYVDAFHSLHPQTRVQVRVNPGDTLEQQLLHNQLDLALIESGVSAPELLAEAYLEDTLIAVCAPGRPFASGQTVTLEQLRGQNFLLREKGSAARKAFDAAALAAGLSVEPAWEATSTTALVNAAVHGLGIAVLPRHMLLGPLERGIIAAFQVPELDLRRRYWIVYHKDKFLTTAARDFIALCKSYEQQHPAPHYNGLY